VTKFGVVSFGSPVPIYCKICDKKITDIERLITPTDFRKRFPKCPHCNRTLKETDVFYLIGESRL
jgi:NAD-dependent SIR2 family protein deacetylase